MHFLESLVAAVVLAACAAGGGAAQTAEPSARPSLTLADCEVPGVKGRARCGTYEVFENRATRRGRKIKLKVVVLPATGAERAPDPYFYIAGGPGSSATGDAPGVAHQSAKIRERRDLVFLDQRGTGGSNPLDCPLFDPNDLQSHLENFLPLEAVRRCRAELEGRADLTLYTTPLAADDLEEVRAALGYGRINLLGTSYGTRAALVYLRRHPESVRTVTLHGVLPTDELITLAYAEDAQRALDGVLGECERDAECRAAFPRAREEARAVFDRLRRGPVEVEILHPQSGQNARVRLSRNLAGEAVRYMLYHPVPASQIPLTLHLAAAGDFTPLAEAALFYRQQIVGSGSNGLYLSVTCSEDLPFIKPGEAEGPRVEQTFLGSYRHVQQRAACQLWPRGPVPADYAEPTRSQAPVLLLTGEWDPVTPPAHGEQALKHLPNGVHVLVPSGGHSFGGLEGVECVDRLKTEFVERGTAKGLDTSCAARIRRRGFVTSAPETKTVALSDAELSKLAGRFAAEAGGFEVESVMMPGGRLRLSTVGGGPTFIAAPVSPTKFRAAGAPGLYFIFEMRDGRAERLYGEEGGRRIFALTKK